MMKAAIWTAYGDPHVLKVQNIDSPSLKDDEILINIHASAVTTGDARMRAFDVPTGLWLPTRLAFGIVKPRKNIPGMDYAGKVVAVGRNVSTFKPDDRVFGTTGMALGANAHFVSVNAKSAITAIPDSLSFENAVALIFGGLTALHFLKGRITQNDNVLINGASGAVGTAAIQMAKHFGANITGVCSAANQALVTSLGADTVIDYKREDIYQTNTEYNIILDTVGNLTFDSCSKILSPSGKLIQINAGLRTMLSSLFNQRLVCGVSSESDAMLNELISLFNQGALKPVVDKVYPLEQIADAHRYVDTGRKVGNVVLVHNSSNFAANAI